MSFSRNYATSPVAPLAGVAALCALSGPSNAHAARGPSAEYDGPRSRAELDHAAKVLANFPSVRVEISGHTDDRGDDEYNRELSTRRAQAVREYLVEHGVSRDRLETRGVGETEPRDGNATRGGRAKHRRIEFKLISPEAEQR